MNTLILVALAVVAFCYCGGKYCPSVLKQNKEVVLGVLIGLALCSFMGVRLEGISDGNTLSVEGDMAPRPNTHNHEKHKKKDGKPVIYIKENSTIEFKSGWADDDGMNLRMSFSSRNPYYEINTWEVNSKQVNNGGRILSDAINMDLNEISLIVLSEEDFNKKGNYN